MTPLISVIIPVYNVENYIKKCIDSLTAQTYKNIEIILVDDGSPDNSGKICDTAALSDTRISVIHKKNQGVSAARNTALDAMKGDYVTFVDGDDYVSADFIETLYNAIKKECADISTCGHYREYNDGRLIPVLSSPIRASRNIVLSGKDSLIDLYYGKTCSASSGSKLYKTNLFKNVRFPDYIMGEDTFVVYHTFIQAKVIAHTYKPLYYYVQHESSVTNHPSNYFKFYDYVRLYDHIMSCDPYKSDKRYFDALSNRLIENNFWVHMKLRNCPGMFFREKKHIEENIKKYRKYVIANPLAQPRVRLACMLSYSGMNITNSIYDSFVK